MQSFAALPTAGPLGARFPCRAATPIPRRWREQGRRLLGGRSGAARANPRSRGAGRRSRRRRSRARSARRRRPRSSPICAATPPRSPGGRHGQPVDRARTARRGLAAYRGRRPRSRRRAGARRLSRRLRAGRGSARRPRRRSGRRGRARDGRAARGDRPRRRRRRGARSGWRDCRPCSAAPRRALAPEAASDASTFLGAFAILLREGLEALLIVVAMIGFLRKAERRDMLRWVHAGWIGALVAGVATWWAASHLHHHQRRRAAS